MMLVPSLPCTLIVGGVTIEAPTSTRILTVTFFQSGWKCGAFVYDLHV
jgi:hypothetical protein